MLSLLPILALIFPSAAADGTGLLGAGKFLYKPVCAHSCRLFIKSSPLNCKHDIDPEAPPDPEAPASCFLTDAAFLRTMALCIEDHCGVDDVTVPDAEHYWAGHLATGTVGDWSAALRPSITYQDALRLAHGDVRGVDDEEDISVVVAGEPLNRTSRVRHQDFLPVDNWQRSFQWGEFDHGRNSIILACTSVGIPIAVSLFRFLPGHARHASRIDAFLDAPLLGRRHRQPLAGNLGVMPTRGQSLYIAYVIVANLVLLLAPLRTLQPSSRMESHHMQRVLQVGDRAGVLAFALYFALFLSSSRNNLLAWLTGWSRATWLLLHRWLAYACVFQTCLHSLLLLHLYRRWYDLTAESALPYWYWGIVATLCTCLLWPLSVLPVRQRMYEAFLAAHQVLAALVLVAAFLHIYYLYEYNWGYETWIYLAGGLWFFDRAVRILRVVANGVRTAEVTLPDPATDLLRIDVEGVTVEGHVYLYFPTLGWRFWECHPFSVLSTFAVADEEEESAAATSNDEKKTSSGNPTAIVRRASSGDSMGNDASPRRSAKPISSVKPVATFLVRPQKGSTKTLLDRARENNGRLRVKVLVESSYHADPAGRRKLARCSSLVCVAGGVGITAVLPLAKSFAGARARVHWGVRGDDVVRAVAGEVERSGVDVRVSVGERLDLEAILGEEIMDGRDAGAVGVVVCGPPGMADDVRVLVGQLAGTKGARDVVFIDEAFSW